MLLPYPALFASVALAHPATAGIGGAAARDTIGQRIAVEIGPDAVLVRYLAEVPAKRVYAEARAEGADATWAARRADELGDALAVTWDGQPLALQEVPVAEPARAGEAGFVDFRAERRATLPSPAGTLGVRNPNFPDDRCYFAVEARISGDLVVEETTLVRVEDGRLRDNRHGAWQQDERARETTIAVRRAGVFERAEGDAPLPERMAGIVPAGPPPWLVAALVVSLLPIAWLGRRLGRRARAIREAGDRTGEAP